MKSEKGVTLTILIIYIILIMLVISFLSLISNYFYSNTSYITEMGKYVSEFNKFNMFFINDAKSNSDVYSIQSDKVVFEDGTIYTYSRGAIYRNKVKICSNLQNCSFEKVEETDDNNFTKIIINVKMIIDGTMPFGAENDYVLKYW